MIVRLVKPGEWEATLEIPRTPLTQEQVARKLRADGLAARRVGREVVVDVPS